MVIHTEKFNNKKYNEILDLHPKSIKICTPKNKKKIFIVIKQDFWKNLKNIKYIYQQSIYIYKKYLLFV